MNRQAKVSQTKPRRRFQKQYYFDKHEFFWQIYHTDRKENYEEIYKKI